MSFSGRGSRGIYCTLLENGTARNVPLRFFLIVVHVLLFSDLFELSFGNGEIDRHRSILDLLHVHFFYCLDRVRSALELDEGEASHFAIFLFWNVDVQYFTEFPERFFQIVLIRFERKVAHDDARFL